jgi:hypothetical protein
MTTREAQRWVQQYFRHFDERSGDELYTVVEKLCGSFDPLPTELREEYPRAVTYHDLWLEILTDAITEMDDPSQWLSQLYPLYVKDQMVRGGSPPSKDGFTQWLSAMADDDDVEACLQSWPPPESQDRT